MKRIIFLTMILGLLSGSAIAGPFPSNVANDVWSGTVNGIPTANDKNDGIPDIYDAVNRIMGSSYTANKDVDPLFVEPDEVWKMLSDGSIALIGLTAGNANTLGVYTDLGTGLNRSVVSGPYSGFGFKAAGTSSDPYPGAVVPLSAGTEFGWYLQSNSTYYYSEASLNPGGWDHVMTFDLPNFPDSLYVDFGKGSILWELHDPFLITWEDLNMGDQDYDDMIYLVDRVIPTPVPGAFLLGALGIGAAGMKLRKFA